MSDVRPGWTRSIPFVVALALPGVAFAGGFVGGPWVPEGPAPNTNGQVENIVPDDEVTGSVNAVAAHPTDPDVVYLGVTNGGVWKTENASAGSPTWAPQTDGFASLSIAAVDIDPTDGTEPRPVAAGIGRFSSLSRRGGQRLGVLLDTGSGFELKNGGGTLVGKNISGIALRGSVIVVSADSADVNVNSERGVFRSADGGDTFTRVSVGDGTTTGLPEGRSFDIGRDPSNAARLYTAILDNPTSALNGIYRSDDTGATWTKVSNSTQDGQVSSSSNTEFAGGPTGRMYVVITVGGSTQGVFYTDNQGGLWTQMDTPDTHPGGQASIHLSLVADPRSGHESLVYIGGDRQNIGNFGAQDFSGRLFRGDTTQPSGSQWVHLTHVIGCGGCPPGGGTASSSAPHADSREMAFDAGGNIIEVDDGGVFRRTVPESNSGDWFSINGNLQSTENHSMAWDTNADIVQAGAQDTGTPMQLVTGEPRWFSISTADGGDVLADDASTPGVASRYSSFQVFQQFRRQVRDADNNLVNQTFPALTVVSGPSASFSFVTPLALNAGNEASFAIGCNNGVYETVDMGTTIRRVDGLTSAITGLGADPMAFGVPGDPDILWAGAGSSVFVRTGAFPAPFTQAASYPGGAVLGIALDPADGGTAYVTDGSSIYRTDDTGGSWAEITGDLGGFDPGEVRSIEYLASPLDGDAVVVGSNRGIYAAHESGGFSDWEQVGSGLPNAPVYELDYDAPEDRLVAGLFGRGTWSLVAPLGPATLLFQDGFESGDTTRWTLTVD